MTHHWQRTAGTASGLWAQEPGPAYCAVAWLGQAGFMVRMGSSRLLIDPYLSDSLEVKYRGTDKPHPRMMPAPVRAEELTGTHYVLCTHRHTDHMDGETLREIARLNPGCRYVVPRAEEAHAVSLGLAAECVITINAGERLELHPGLTVEALPSAHEKLETDAQGNHRYLGYILRAGEIAIYHSGDTVPYPGLAESLACEGISLALLPVNGCGKRVAGNLTFPEAVELCCAAGIPQLVPHHFGMFAFNTVDPTGFDLPHAAQRGVTCLVPDVHSTFIYKP